MPMTPFGFTARLLRANGLDPDALRAWVFFPGMRYGSSAKWWGDFGRRDFPHEGVDFALFRRPSGELQRLGPETLIPALFGGRVRAVFRDYLGQAVVVEHAGAAGEKGLAVYAHTRPREGLAPGVCVEAGEVIAAIADTASSKARILPHLHLSLARPAPGLVYENFVWNRMRDPAQVTLLDPAGHIGGPWEEADPRSLPAMGGAHV